LHKETCLVAEWFLGGDAPTFGLANLHEIFIEFKPVRTSYMRKSNCKRLRLGKIG